MIKLNQICNRIFDRRVLIAILLFVFLLVLSFTAFYFIKFDLGGGYFSRNGMVYYDAEPLERADKNSFEVLQKKFARDKTYVYFKDFKFAGTQSHTFEILSDKYCKDINYGYVYNDKKIIRLPNSDGSSFELAERDGYAKDKNKHYYFDGIDFYMMQNVGFEFIDNNAKHDARDENHYFLRGKMVGSTEEFETIFIESAKKYEEEKAAEILEEAGRFSGIFKIRKTGKSGQEIDLENFMAKSSSTISKIIETVTKGPPYYPADLQNNPGEVVYKVFSIEQSPDDSDVHAVMYGLDKEKSFNSCCEYPHGIFLTNGEILLNSGKLNRIGGEYDFSRQSNLYFDYDSIGDLVWASSTLFYDIVVGCGNTEKFESVCKNKVLDNSIILKYAKEIAADERSIINDIGAIKLPKNGNLISMVRDEIARIKPEIKNSDILGLYEIKDIFYSSPNQNYMAVIFGLSGLSGHGIMVTDGKVPLETQFNYISAGCINGCGGSINISNIQWKGYYFEFSTEKCSEIGCETNTGMIYPNKSVLQ